MECGKLCPYNITHKIVCNGQEIPSLSREHIEAVKFLGMGATGRAYLATLNRHLVVVKYIEFVDYIISAMGPIDFIQRFNNEVCMQQRANEGRLAPRILGAWKCDDLHKEVIVMEYVDGLRLFEYLKDNPSDLVNIYLDVIGKAVYLNQVVGIIHGDLHAKNIMLDRGNIIFIDYGDAREYPSMSEIIENEKGPPFYFDDLSVFSISIQHIIQQNFLYDPDITILRDIIIDNDLKEEKGWKKISISFYEKYDKLPGPDDVRNIIRDFLAESVLL